MGRLQRGLCLLLSGCAFIVASTDARSAQGDGADVSIAGAGGLPSQTTTDSTGGVSSSSSGGDAAKDIRKSGRNESPRVTGVRACGGIVRGVIAGGSVTLELNKPLPPGATVRAELDPLDSPDGNPSISLATKRTTSQLQHQGFSGDNLVFTVPSDLESGTYRIGLSITTDEVPKIDGFVPDPQYVRVQSKSFLIKIASLPVGLLLGLFVVTSFYRRSAGTPRQSVTSLLFLEPKNQTYSLSRAQFVAWMVALGFAYVFTFAAQGFLHNIWAFPALSGFWMTFLVSLGTLVAAQATSSTKGVKGAGGFKPSLADLFMHGGVLALERVQQVLWTIIAIGMFLFILFQNYATAAEVAPIPNELLILMGVSAVGYVGGKAVRNAGPVVSGIEPLESKEPRLKIVGDNFSRTAQVTVDDVLREVTQLDPPVRTFANSLEVRCPSDWYAKPRRVVVVNEDGQCAEWLSTPELQVIQTKLETNDGKETLLVTAETKYVSKLAQWIVTGGKFESGKIIEQKAPSTCVAPAAPAASKPEAGKSGAAEPSASTESKASEPAPTPAKQPPSILWEIRITPAKTQRKGTLSVQIGSTPDVTADWVIEEK